MDQNINLPGYLNRYDPARQYDTVLYRSDKVIQSDELNETQSALQARLRGVADVLLADGAVIRDARIMVNPVNGATTCESGALYVDGAVRGVAPAALVVPVIGIVVVGVYLQQHIITELEDPSLRNRAKDTRGYDKPGAARLQKLLIWGMAGDSQAGDFYPVYTIEDGTVRSKEPPPQLDGVTQALARYDRDSSGGSYVVNGLNVSAADNLPTGEQVYTVSEGRARVNGFAVELATSRRLLYATQPDLRYIDNEPHQSTGTAAQRINFDRAPAANIVRVTITAQKTLDVAHGGFTGALDPLEDGSVLAVLSVKQGNTTYVKDVDWKLTAQQIDWSLPGAEPAPGSTYKVTYQYLATVAATAIDADGCSITGAVTGTAILLSYNRMLPRIDRLCMDANGAMLWLPGVAAERNPRAPNVPANLLPLASITQTWRTGSDTRNISNDSVRVVAMDTLAAYSQRLDYLTEMMAQQRLESSTQQIEAGIKRGIFVDSFFSDSLRDQGIKQTAAIFGGELSLPVASNAYALSQDITAPLCLPYTLVPVLEQPLRTTSMKINPYDAFDPLPADVTLTPAVDRWTDVDTIWAAGFTTQAITQNITRSKGVYVPDAMANQVLISERSYYETTGSSSQILSSASRPAEFLRQISVSFSVKGFSKGETLASLRFDGITLVPLASQVVDGVLSGSFTIPPKIPVGSKQVEFVGNNGSYGVAIYSGSGLLVSNVTQLVSLQISGWLTTNTVGWKVDPIAQTFTLSAARQIAGVDLWFTAKGTSRLAVQLRATSTGMPNQTVLTMARLDAASVAIDGHSTRIEFEHPVLLEANVEYALVVLCDDAITSLAVAELGKYDAQRNQWVSSQPYTVGVLLSSSNASTWTAHQDRDLSFRLLAADFSATSKTVNLGGMDLQNVTDLMLLMLAETPSAATRVEYQVSTPDGTTITVDEGQPVSLNSPASGRFNISAKLSGSMGATGLSPVLYPGATLLAGSIANQADYVTRLIPAGPQVRTRIVLQSHLPAGSALKVSVAAETAGDVAPVYIAAPFLSSRDIAADWVELTYELPSISADRIRVRLELSGTTASRPRHRNLRAIVI